MEVHAHSHTTRKKWTHYFWEFLMLFLAVFCGFFAEYKLEHRIEKDKAKQYIRSFYEDLKSDTTGISIPIADYLEAAIYLNKRNDCYQSIRDNPGSVDCLDQLFNYSSRFTDLITADQTILQLKNAGGFRLLDKSDTDSILSYDRLIRLFIKGETTGFQNTQNYLRTLIFTLKDYGSEIRKQPGGSVLYGTNRELLNTYFNTLNRYANYSNFNLEQLLALKQRAAGLLLFFKNKYHFK